MFGALHLPWDLSGAPQSPIITEIRAHSAGTACRWSHTNQRGKRNQTNSATSQGIAPHILPYESEPEGKRSDFQTFVDSPALDALKVREFFGARVR